MVNKVVVDGVEYYPQLQCGQSKKIGVGITTKNRNDIVSICVDNVKKYTPNAEIIVVDDGSIIPVVDATFRFNNSVGIAKAKNKCIELLYNLGCEHIFLFDDDTYPIKDGWFEDYVNCSEPHLNYIFMDFANTNGKKVLNDTKVLYESNDYIAYSHPRGCMLYFDRKCFDVVGGMDANMAGWGYEHGDLSNRIYNAGLTTFRYMDIKNSSGLFYSADEHQAIQSTVNSVEKNRNLEINRKIHDCRWNDKLYCEFREKRNVVISHYLTSKVDKQRNKKWVPNKNDINVLLNSLNKNNIDSVIFTDELDGDNFIKVKSYYPAYIERWLLSLKYLKENDDIDFVWLVDSTDTELLNVPFNDMKRGILYCGSEHNTLNDAWMIEHNKYINDWLLLNSDKQLLNCGLVGGDRDTIIRLCQDLIKVFFNSFIDNKDLYFDMGPFNFAAYTGGFNIKTGPLVHSLFKYNEKTGWWKHK